MQVDYNNDNYVSNDLYQSLAGASLMVCSSTLALRLLLVKSIEFAIAFDYGALFVSDRARWDVLKNSFDDYPKETISSDNQSPTFREGERIPRSL